jgi:hypothetical protein
VRVIQYNIRAKFACVEAIMDVPASANCRPILLGAFIGVLAATIPLSSSSQNLDTLTVEAQRQREKLSHDVNVFVSSAIVQSHNDESLERWTYNKVCPMVGGLNKEQGEFILARVSEIARAARAPLGGEKCTPNLYVLVSGDPESLLKRHAAMRPANFNYETGPQLDKFIEKPRPIRVWYNAGITSLDGAALVSSLGDTSDIHARKFAGDALANRLPSQYASRLNAASVTRDIVSVIIVVDVNKVRDLNFGQIADYIGLIGLAQIDLDHDTGDAPTILNLFKQANSRPQGMTEWDKALLHALYRTSHKDKMQLSQIQTAALKEIADSGQAKN